MKKMIVAALVAFAGIPAEAQTAAPRAAPKVGLPMGAILMLPAQPPKPSYLMLPAQPSKPSRPCLSHAPRDFPVPQGLELWKIDPSSKCLVDLGLDEILDSLVRCDKQWSRGKIRDGRVCVCKNLRPCEWEAIPEEKLPEKSN